jgi:antitoxin HicB
MNKADMINNYAIQVKPLTKDFGGGFEALFPQLARGVVGYGATQQEAVKDLLEAVPDFLEAVEEMGQSLPAAETPKEWDEFSGKFNVRVPKMLHAKLVRLADEQGVSLNSLVQTILMSGATALEAGLEFGAVVEPEPVLAMAPSF